MEVRGIGPVRRLEERWSGDRDCERDQHPGRGHALGCRACRGVTESRDPQELSKTTTPLMQAGSQCEKEAGLPGSPAVGWRS